MPAKHSVAILGGGVGGLSAAHELAERGFEVTVYERNAVFGGKARSLSVAASGVGGRKDLPGEHGFRFFPGFYKHVTDTMSRIPFGTHSGNCRDSLVQATRILLARQGKLDPVWVGRFPETIDDFRTAFLALFDNLDIPHHEVMYFVTRLLTLATSCEERYEREYEQVAFWDFIEADTRSENYRKYLGQGLTRSLVAMRAEESSTRTVGRILLQLFYGILVPGRVFDRLLNGPTNDVWIDPWRTHLTEQLGVTLVSSATVRAFNLTGDRIRSVSVERNGYVEEVTADFHVAALPVEIMQGLITSDLIRAAPSLARLGELRTEWMNGIQFYLETDEPLTDGHAIYLDSSWALTSISQRQFWRGYDLSEYGDGRVSGVLSVDISNWTAPGNFNGRPAMAATSREEIKDEVWEQLKAALNSPGPMQLEDRNLVDWFLDPDIQLPNPSTVTNLEPLLINRVGSFAARPEAYTEIGNLFLAADYVRTHTDLATMEAANEAARRATNAILAVSGVAAPPCNLWEFDIPLAMRNAQRLDQVRFRMGLPNLFALGGRGLAHDDPPAN
ncbi:MAG: FAD-dependent oxidoreductase [Betaproteobacteria bacterium]|nr:MAG: FAD-dependent oxidoreductase [Betaproteobacteria bacterium]